MRGRSNKPKKTVENDASKKPTMKKAVKSAVKKTAGKTELKKKTIKKTASVSKSVDKKVNTKKNADKKSIRKKVPLRRKKLKPQDLDYRYLDRSGRWVIIQLSEETDLKEDAEAIVEKLKNICGEDVEYFLPSYTEYVKEKAVCIVLFDGYIFVRESDKVGAYCFKDKNEYFDGPLFCGGQCQYVKNKDINNFKKELKKRLKSKVPKKGETVVPKVGDYRNLEGVVLLVDRKKMIAKVEFALASRVVEVYIRIINLDVQE